MIDVTPDGLLLREVAPGFSVADVQAKTEAKLWVTTEPAQIMVSRQAL